MDLISRFISHVDWQLNMLTALRILLVLIVVWIALKLVRVAMQRLEKRPVARGKMEGEETTETSKRAEALSRLKISFPTIVLRDLSGVLHVFPKGGINTLANLAREWSGDVFDIGVAHKEDVDGVIETMRPVGGELREHPEFGSMMVSDIAIFGVGAFADSAVTIKGRLKTRSTKQWDVGREYRRRLKKTFDQEGIEIPFPHRSIHFGEQSKPIATQLVSMAEN